MITRHPFTRALFLSLILLSGIYGRAEVNQVQKLTPTVYFHEGEIKGKGHCNNGWIIFEDYVLVIDANFPSGAQEILPKIKALTDKPIRFVFDTHHHGDHAYANQFWVENGAVPVAQAGVLDEMKKYEPARWNDMAKSRPDVAASKLKVPTVFYRNEMLFDDGRQRAELLYFGVAHTRGDGFVWLPEEKILFTGDACVNGAYNYAADGDIAQWIQTLEAAKKLGAKIVCPGHGPTGTGELLEDQQKYFIELRSEVKKISQRPPAEAKAAVPEIKSALEKQERIKRFVGGGLAAHVEKVFVEMGGQPFSKSAALDEHHLHLVAHGGEVAGTAP